jgi:AcrR family transcriptional regulator
VPEVVAVRARNTQTPAAIVAAAMALFGERGIAATSLRDVAKAAQVSAGLIVHYFGSRDGLIAATDEAALREFGEAYYHPGEDGLAQEGAALLRARAEQTSRVMRERRDVCVYLGRALVEATPGSARLFRLMIEGGRAEVGVLSERGELRKDTDLLWATLQHFFLIWAPLSFTALLDQEVLEGSLLDESNLDRWVEANVHLLKEGIYK